MSIIGMFVITLLASVSLVAQTATAPAAGNGLEENPYEISSLENLYWIAASDSVVPVPNQAALDTSRVCI